jgi:hypothetical protein
MKAYGMMEAIRRERPAELDVMFDGLGSRCRFDKTKEMSHERAHWVLDLTPESRLGVDHLDSRVSYQPSTLDDERRTIWVDS